MGMGMPHQDQDQMDKSAEQFKVGDKVEVSFERDEAYDVWFPATVIKYLPDDNSYLVQFWYRKDGTDQASLQKSTVRSSRIRPQSPSGRKRSFRLSDIVDAFYDFAWTTGVIIKDFNDKKFMVSFKRTDNKMVFSETKLRFHMEWVDGKWLVASQARVADNDMPHSRPSKKSKSENAEVPTLTACKNDAAKETKKTKQDLSVQPKTPFSIVCQTEVAEPKRLCTVSVFKTNTVSLGDKVTKEENVKGLKKDTARSCKRKGRPSRFRPLLTEGNESNEVVRTAEDTDEKGCEMEHITPIVLAVTQSGTNSPLDIIPREFGKEGFQTDQNGQGTDPSGLVIETKGKNVEELENDTTKFCKKRGRKSKNGKSSTGGNESNTGVKTSKDTAEKGCEIEHIAPIILTLAQTSISDQNREGNDSAGLFIEENPKKNQREMSLELLGPVEISTKPSEKGDENIDVNQVLPFERTVPLWDTLESLEVFKSIPQKPHFRPLESSSEECREGLALGHMVTFLKIASKIPELQFDTPTSSVESSLRNLVVLEDNGFDVKLVRECLNHLLVKKNKIEQLQNELKVCDGEILGYKNKKADIDKVVDEFDKMLEEIRAKRDVAVSEREKQESGLARSQSTWDEINKRIKTIESDFKKKCSAASW